VTIDSRLLKRLGEKLGVGERQVYNRINDRSRSLLISPEQAAISLALENRVSVRGLATEDDMAAIRTATIAKAPVAAPATREAPAARKKSVARSPTARRRKGGKTVFVIHGRDERLRKSMFDFLKALSLEPIEFSRAVNKAVKAGKGGSPYVGDVVAKGLKDADGVIALLSPDDVARLKTQFRKPHDSSHESQLTGQARANVLFETGMALGIKPEVTILVQVGEVRTFSDVGGMHVVHLNDGPVARRELADRLEATGLDVDTSGTGWYGAGTFIPG
jgi:predicted nucleotide-binding protein